MSNPVFAPERRTLSAPTVWFKIGGRGCVLVLIKDDLFIKRMLTQKASVYPGFFLTSEFTS